MSNTEDGKEPKVRQTFCVRFRGDEKQRVQAVAKSNGKSLAQFIREVVLEKSGVEPSR